MKTIKITDEAHNKLKIFVAKKSQKMESVASDAILEYIKALSYPLRAKKTNQ